MPFFRSLVVMVGMVTPGEDWVMGRVGLTGPSVTG